MKEIQIGSQIWAQEDLKVTRFRNGDLIPVVQDPEEWAMMPSPGMCIDPDTDSFLYNWYAVNDPRGLAPEGWHIPSDAEWTELADFLGGDVVAGFKMKYVNPVWNGTNESGFSAFPRGYRSNYSGYFYNEGYFGFWWSSSPDGNNAWGRFLSSYNGYVNRSYYDRRFGFSVRCVKDEVVRAEKPAKRLESKF